MSPPLICTSLCGGIGNQLFQYAAGRELAMRHDAELLLDDRLLLHPARGTTPRGFELHHFRIRARFVPPDRETSLRVAKGLGPLAHVFTPWHVLSERATSYDSRFETAPANTCLVGYWQSYKYFVDAAAALSDELTAAAPMSLSSQGFASLIDTAVAVAVHVRRGDYVSLASAAKFHGTLSVAYYANALALVRSSVSTARFFVFSDDLAWCRANLPLQEVDAVFVDRGSESPAWEDLALMARCRHHIIANSSFSWWGAWLADQRFGARRQVAAPRDWFVDKQRASADRFPPHWKVL